MVDIESTIFNQIANAYSSEFPNGSRYGEPTEAPAKFPALVVYEADRMFSGYSELDSNRIVIDVDVYSNLVNGAKQECKAIMDLVENTMMSFGKWELVFCNQFRNADQRIYRMKARYRGTAVQETNDDGNIAVRIYRR